MRKKILAVTGIRSEYDLIYPVLKKIHNDRNFDLKLVVVGAHLSEWHGFTLNTIKSDGFKIVDKIDYLLSTNRKTQRSKGVGLLVEGLTQTVERVKPDILLFAGDREESIATCLVGNYMNVLVAHIGGGDTVYGNADDPVRWACSKLAHIHFATSKKYANNIKKIGEESFRICFSGNPALNNIINTRKIDTEKLSKILDIDIKNHDYIVVLKHPLSSELENSSYQMSTTMRALKSFSTENNMKVIGIYPNTDPGSHEILRVIDRYSDKNIKFFKSLNREIFVNLMRNARVLIGNSSMGILEAPFYKLPVINVGNRQKGRLNAGNVEFSKYNIKQIKKLLTKACFDKKYRKKISKLNNPYGDGYAQDKIIKFLKLINLKDKKWLTKKKLI